MREIAFDCRHFLGDRPCVWHKQTGALCTCDRYDRVDERVLMIKLDAMGDVLRTTALLGPLREVHPNGSITWITRRESVPLLRGNPHITEVVEYGPDAIALLLARTFDRVINLDASRTSASLAAMSRSVRKDGYILDERGVVEATNPSAAEWLETGVFDDIKRQGTRTYQDRMAEILGLQGRAHSYVLQLAPQEVERARAHLLSAGLDPGRPLVGLNTGAGGRWPLKQWREDGFVELVDTFVDAHGVQFVLLGGPDEAERNRRIRARCRGAVLDPGADNPIRHFAALLGHCDVVVTGDTLAMHVALALGRRAVVLFGPTSAPEIEMYGLGEKVVPDMGCLSCYKTSCDFSPNCMDLISVRDVFDALARQLVLARPA